MERLDLAARLRGGALDEALARLYGRDSLDAARARSLHVLEAFSSAFSRAPEALFSAPGRTELCGNHTDHQHGRVLAAAVNLDILAAAAPNGSSVVRIRSEGYPAVEADLNDLAPKADERNTSAALVRGVASRFAAAGCPPQGAGFDAYMVSTVPGGSGLSSSSAFEVLIGRIFNDLFCGGRRSPVELAEIGRYAENAYFGKPCGLMDQLACAVGGVVAVDFDEPASPKIEQLTLDLNEHGHALCIVDSGPGHAGLTGEYAAITDELRAVCRFFGAEFLRDVPEERFLAALPAVRRAAGDRAVLRALHVYAENRRAAGAAEALREGDFGRFLALVRESGRSSAMYLQNIVPCGRSANQALMLTLGLAERILGGRGAVRVHGGGFGGTAAAFVPLAMLSDFKARTEAVLDAGACHVVSIRPAGAVRIDC